jgi:hypothetical protein
MNFLCGCNVLRWIYDVCDVTLSSNITMFVMLHRLRVTSQTTMKQLSFIDWSMIKRCKSEAWAARVNHHVQSFFKSFRMSACRFHYSFGIACELLRLWHLLVAGALCASSDYRFRLFADCKSQNDLRHFFVKHYVITFSRWIQDGRLLGSVFGNNFIDFVHIFFIFSMKLNSFPISQTL